jgi:signal transduction histidine kinase/CheY-like chemotaxis protein
MAELGAVSAAPAAPAAAVPHHDPASAKLAESVRFTYDYMPSALAGYMAGVGVVAMLFWGVAPMAMLVPWMAVFTVVCAVRLVVIRAFKRAAHAESTTWALADWRRWYGRSNIGTVVSASLWGAAGWLFYDQGTGLEQTGLIVIVYTYCAVGIPVLSIQRRLYLAFAALVFLPLLARIVMVGDRFHYLLAGELVLIISFTFVLANSYRQALQRAIDLKVQADELAAQLRTETLAADAARREAEIANRAKTQFFTAASHDLRQPLHAMGLFAEALRQRVHEPEVAQLVNSINESVDALEGLFSELLDITRIDSGGVEVHAQHFEVGDILRKLRLHFEPSAFEKGLALRLRGGQRVVFADPLLVERILRNLVSNAIRYTDDGSVLVSCRERNGRVLLQVWDSGPGIREAERAKIFDEFYQVPHTAAVSPEQRKGLGLGLAIVKRLAALMDAPLSMQSTVGRGTVFTLELPIGKAPRAPAQRLPGKGPVGITLAGRLIVIVEDEPAVRAGLEVLLKGWGADIAAFESVTESTRWAEASDPSVVKPDLLIVDYRLEEGRTGVDAIRSLRERFGPKVPAILVTGSTMTGHDKEAQAHDFHLLIKPVVPNKLRAMIAFKLGVKALG